MSSSTRLHGPLWLLVCVVLLGSVLSAQAEERITALHQVYNESPWDYRDFWNPASPTYLDGFARKERLSSDITFCDLDPSVGDYLTVRWSSGSPRVLLQLKISSNVTPILAAAHPVGTFRFRVVEADNCTIKLFSGGPAHTYAEPGAYTVITHYDCIKELGKYGAVGKQIFEITPIDPSLPYTGGIAFISYRIECDAANSDYQVRYEALKHVTGSYQGEVSANALTAKEVVLSGVPGEPLCFSLRFPTPVTKASVSADLSADDSKVRWVSTWKPFLMNDPTLAQTTADLDAPTLQAVTAGGPDAATEKAWVSFTIPSDAQPTTPSSPRIGTVKVSSGSSVINTIDVRLQVYDFLLPQKGVVGAGIYVVGGRYGKDMWDQTHAWMDKARIEWATSSVQVPLKCINGRDPDGRPYAQTDLLECFLNRRKNGLPELRLFSSGLLTYEIWRYMHGPAGERYNLDSWIGQSLDEKIQYTLAEYQNQERGVQDVWVYSYDEGQSGALTQMAPMLKRIRQNGARIFAAIHPDFYEMEDIRDTIDFWVMTERNYIFSERARKAGKFTGKYGYPFTDIHGYAVHRREYFNCLYSGVDFYFNYALNDIAGDTFDDERKMCLIIATEAGLIETESSEGFIRGAYDMRYLAAVKRIAETVLHTAPSNRPARQALQYLDTLHPDMDYNLLKDKIASIIMQLNEELYALDRREATG